MAINFTDSPADGATQVVDGRTYTYNSAKNKWDTTASSGGVTEFTGLSDTPSTLGTAGQVAQVNSGATALEFADPSGVTVYATANLLPGTANAGDMAFVTATNRLYLWNGSGWYNIALINTNPTMSGVSSAYQLATDGTPTTVTITATDPEGVPITYSIASDTSGNIATVSQGTGSNTNVFTITPSTNAAHQGGFSLTFRASDGVNIASSVASFTLSFSVVNSKYTTALITSVGANNAVNNSFTDSSGNSHAITAFGDVTQGTLSPFRQNGYSWRFDGLNDYIRTPTNTTTIGTNDFTYEAWIYDTNPSTTDWRAIIAAQYGSTGIGFFTHQSRLSAYGVGEILVGPTYNKNEWNHVVLTRESGTLYMYLNGVKHSNSASNTYNLTRTQFEIGANGQSAELFKGFITDARIVNGTAVYTANFTPPTERLTAITNTSILLGSLPYQADASGNNHRLTSTYPPTMQPFTPFDSEDEYASSTDGGSIYFNGTNAYLRADTALDSMTSGNTEWTLEAWVYPNNLGGTGSSSSDFFGCNRTTDGHDVLTVGPAQLRVDANTHADLQDLINRQWQHVAVVYHTGYNGLRYYVNGYHVNSYNPLSTQPALADCAFGIGCKFNGSSLTPGNYFSGLLSDVRVSDHDIYGVSTSYSPTNPLTQEFTPPTGPLTATNDTDFLLHATNAGIIDKSQSVQAVTLKGNANSSTTQTKYLTSSMYFDGTGDYLTIPYVTEHYDWWNKDFTIEAWIYPTTFTGWYTGSSVGEISTLIGNMDPTVLTCYWSFGITSTGAVRFFYYNGSSVNTPSSTETVNLNEWSHIAFVKDSNGYKYFVNGVGGSYTSISGTPQSNATTGLTIGSLTSDSINGYVSDVRITSGLARYTANFTPPTAALDG